MQDSTPPLLKKSRSGCKECRRRKVKCDEVRPICGNCERRFVDLDACEYNEQIPPRRISRPRKREASQQTVDLVRNEPSRGLSPCVIGDDCSALRALELRLMYHWATVVCPIMPSWNTRGKQHCQEVLTQSAFQTDITMSPLLALSALHLLAHSPDDEILSISLSQYVDCALKRQREWIEQTPREPKVVIWLAASMLANIAWHMGNRRQGDEAYQLPLSALKMAAGCKALFLQSPEYFKREGYATTCLGGPLPLLDDLQLPPESLQQLQVVVADLDSLLEGFHVGQMPVDADRTAYQDAAEYIKFLYRAYFSLVPADTLRRAVFAMPLRANEGFIRLLEAHQPLSMALYARALVFCKGFEEAWWLNGKGPYEAVSQNVLGMYGLMPPEFHWSMDWPLKMLAGEFQLTRPSIDPMLATQLWNSQETLDFLSGTETVPVTSPDDLVQWYQ
ncbi:hypothetical protein GGR56DRAFT_571388 [Xylariaceae sp. FL0804]|nr:hypothetical protein GGR56DRAFT_571388 [Xylariaceae sp. FL0804]